MSKARLVLPGVPHHIWIRGNNRRRLFSYPWEYLLMTLQMCDALEKYPLDIWALALLENHLHGVVVPPTKESPSLWVQSWAQRYARGRNERRGSSGKLFEHPFDCEPILSEQYLANCMAYVENNPVKAGLCRTAGDWEWSTYNLHVGQPSKIPRRLWTPSPWFQKLGVEGYQQWVAERAAAPDPDEPEVRVRRPDGTRAT